jgi:peptide/nickel transport system substrate-binding protein
MRRTAPLLALLAVVTGCGSIGSAHAPSSGPAAVLRIAIGVEPDTLDPMRQTTTTVANVVQMVVESLTRVDQDGQIQPALATGWQEASDGLRWTFTLRPGVRFSDGTPLDAAAVAASLDRVLDPSSVCPGCGLLRGVVTSVVVDDSSHVTLVAGVPLAADVVLGVLSLGTNGILSPRTILKGTPGYVQQERPVGTGPYALAERVKGDHVTLVRNDRYWGARPAYARQVVDVVGDAATREALVRSGQADVALLPPIADLPAMRADANVKVLLAPGDRSIFVALDTVDQRQPLLRRREVRRALNFAINRDAIVASTLFGAGDSATSVMAPSVFGYCAPPDPYRYDPELARSMLQQAGASHLSITLVAPTGRYIQDFQAAQNIAGDLRAIGVNVQGPRTMDWPSYISTVEVPPAAASVDAHLLGWAPQYLDASIAMMQFDPSQIPPRGLATSYYDNPAVAALLAKAQVEPDREARVQEYCDAERQVWNDAPWIFLWTEKFPIVYSSAVTGVTSIPTESFDTVHARPAR